MLPLVEVEVVGDPGLLWALRGVGVAQPKSEHGPEIWLPIRVVSTPFSFLLRQRRVEHRCQDTMPRRNANTKESPHILRIHGKWTSIGVGTGGFCTQNSTAWELMMAAAAMIEVPDGFQCGVAALHPLKDKTFHQLEKKEVNPKPNNRGNETRTFPFFFKKKELDAPFVLSITDSQRFRLQVWVGPLQVEALDPAVENETSQPRSTACHASMARQ